jgi:hypothetical protein
MSVPNLPQSHSQSTQWQDLPSDPAALQHANLLTQSTDLATLHQQITELSLRASRVTGLDLQSVLWTVGVRNLLAKRSQDEASALRDVHIVLKNLEVLVSAEGQENGSMERLENGIGGSSSAGTKSPMKEPGKQPPKSPISAHSTFSGDQLLNLPIVWNDRRLDDARIAFTYMAEFVKEQCIESQKTLSHTQVLSVRHLKTVYKEYNKTLVNPRFWHEQWFGQGENGTCQAQYVTPQLFTLQDIIREAKAKWPLECTDEAIERLRSIKAETRQ